MGKEATPSTHATELESCSVPAGSTLHAWGQADDVSEEQTMATPDTTTTVRFTQCIAIILIHNAFRARRQPLQHHLSYLHQHHIVRFFDRFLCKNMLFSSTKDLQ